MVDVETISAVSRMSLLGGVAAQFGSVDAMYMEGMSSVRAGFVTTAKRVGRRKNRVLLMLIYSGGDTRYASGVPRIAELMPSTGFLHVHRE